MGDEAYSRYEDRDRGRASHHESLFPFPQPHFNQTAKPVPTRDRYRTPQFGNPAYDDVEDDDPYGQDEGVQFDSFGT